jgi:septum formation topological specificity factor MinE
MIMGQVIQERSKMVVEISRIRNLDSDSTLDLIIALKQNLDREILDIIDKYLQINDQRDIKIVISRQDDKSKFVSKE